jgi:alcohol dehydrogenase class IV
MPSPACAFEFAQPERIVFGPGKVTQAGTLTASLGQSALLVTGRDLRRAEPVRESFRSAGLNWVEWTVAGEPTVSEVRAGAEAARNLGVDCVVACGGGSVLDAGKAIAALTPQSGDLFQFLEIIGQGLPLENHPLPFLALHALLVDPVYQYHLYRLYRPLVRVLLVDLLVLHHLFLQ